MMQNQPSNPDAVVVLPLAAWSRTMTNALLASQPAEVAPLAQVVLRRLPRHLATYQRLLQAMWLLKDWDEGEEWGRRLLQADPNNALAWRAVARGIAERGERAQAHAVWLRAFEASPYDNAIRAGLARTSLDAASDLTLNQACLATLFRFGYRWRHAAAEYQELVEADPRRLDFLVGLMIALWRLDKSDGAYQIACHLVEQHPHTIMAWLVMAAAGDENDRALAHDPIRSMDPDGEYSRQWLRLADAPQAEQLVERLMPNGDVPLNVTRKEAEFLEPWQG